LIDTGSRLNFISRKRAEYLNKATLKIKINYANNTTMEVSEYLEALVKLKALPGIEFKTKFYVLDTLSVDVILGIEFLYKNSIIINFEDLTLYCEERSIEILESNDKLQEFDSIYFEIAKNVSLLHFNENTIENVVKKTKKLMSKHEILKWKNVN
ncbi:hypothetical protein DMUE_5555, partial [Dictyocoela muelleri]